MKKTKIILPALGLLVLSTAASVTGTVAWFSMNNSVSVTGMNVKTTVGSNILVSATNSEASFAAGLNQPVGGILEPVSTINGVNFFYHSTLSNVMGDGHVTDSTFVAYEAGQAFDANYGFPNDANIDCYGYKDYSFYIKATNGDGAARNLVMSKCNITYKGAAVGDKAWRVALFTVKTAKATTVADNAAAVEGNLVSILRLNEAAYFSDQAVASTSTFGSVNAKIDDASTLGEIAAAATDYYKVIVRLWLEGNDTTCNNDTYAELSGDYDLDLKFELSASDGVDELGSAANAVATASGLTATVTLSETTTGTIANLETAASFQWYNDATGAAIDSATTYQYTAASAMSVYCVVTTARGNQYRTNTVALA